MASGSGCICSHCLCASHQGETWKFVRRSEYDATGERGSVEGTENNARLKCHHDMSLLLNDELGTVHSFRSTLSMRCSPSVQELQELAKRMESSRNKAEKRLGAALVGGLLPRYLETGGGRRRAAERAAALEAAPKKRSSRLQVRLPTSSAQLPQTVKIPERFTCHHVHDRML